MNYTLNQLRIFLKVSELGSVTKASEELYLTQPAVSIQLRKFQDQFSIPLTEVVGRKLYVTPFGKEIAKTAKNVLNEIEQINYKTDLYQKRLAGKLKLSIVSTAKYVMPYFLADFMNSNSAIELSMDVTNKSLVIENLEKNEVDFALMSVIPEGMSLDHIPLMENHLFLISSKEVNSSQNDSLNLKNSPLIYREPGSATRMLMEQVISKEDMSSYKKIELTSNEAVKQAVLSGLGMSIMPIIGLKNSLLNKDLKIHPFKGLPITTTWNLVWLKNKKLSPVSLAFIEYIKSNKEKIIRDKFSWVNDFKI